MEFRVLGPLEVRRGDEAVALPGGKPRAVLARLLVDAGRVVSVDALADALWGEAPPANTAATIQVHISNLRRVLGGGAIVTRSPGYALAVAGHDFDHVALQERVAGARGHRAEGRPADALGEAQQAVALVAGEPYVEFAYEEWARAEMLRLRGVVLAAHEELHASLLDLGRHREALPSLEALVAAHPFHERLRAQLMLALYRDGRQTDALRRCAEGRRLLVEELGVEPGPELCQMEARVLAHDESLRPPGPAPARAPRPAPAMPATLAVATEATDGDALVGRERALGSLRSAWRDACDGRLRIVTIDGEPGTGKSTLARRAVAMADRDGAAIGVGVAHELAGAPPYWPWTSALRDLATGRAAAALAAAMADTPGAAVLRTLLDGSTEGSPVPPQQFQVFDAAARVLDRLGQKAPVLLVLDDLQWADQASLDLLQFLARTQSRGRVLIVASYRPSPTDDHLAAMVANVVTEPTVHRVSVGPLAAEDVHRFVERLVGPPVSAAVSAAIATRTGGNPFLVEELVRVLRTDEGTLDPSRAAVPGSVRALLRRRAARLGEHALEVLTLASFGGGEFNDLVAQRVLDLDPAIVSAVFERAVRDGLVVEVEGRPGFHRFAHNMARHAFYDAVPQRRRAETHVAVGRALVDLLGHDAARWAPELAAHFSQGIDVGGAAEAVHWLRLAAAQAVRSQAFVDGLRDLRRALFVVRSRLRDQRLECEVLIEVAAAARLAADPPTARLARERAIQLATQLGDEALTTHSTNVLLSPGPHWIRRAR